MSIDEAFPCTVGKMAHEYIQNHIRQSDITVTAHGDSGSLHFFHLSDILYITACGKNSYIKTLNGEIPVPAKKFSDMRETLLKMHCTIE